MSDFQSKSFFIFYEKKNQNVLRKHTSIDHRSALSSSEQRGTIDTRSGGASESFPTKQRYSTATTATT
jgi:hypothetical protein